jgi:hypothetical protein
MSTMYVPLEKIRFCHLFDGRLEAFNVREYIPTEEEIGGDEDWRPTERKRVLTDGRYFMWAYADKDGFVDRIVRYGANAPASILNAITEVFSIAIVSERQPQFWGYDTQEEWDAANAGIAEQHEEEFYLDLLRYLRGEPHSIGPVPISSSAWSKHLFWPTRFSFPPRLAGSDVSCHAGAKEMRRSSGNRGPRHWSRRGPAPHSVPMPNTSSRRPPG